MTFKGVSRMYNPDGASAPKKHEHDFGGTCHHINMFPFCFCRAMPQVNQENVEKSPSESN